MIQLCKEDKPKTNCRNSKSVGHTSGGNTTGCQKPSYIRTWLHQIQPNQLPTVQKQSAAIDSQGRNAQLYLKAKM